MEDSDVPPSRAEGGRGRRYVRPAPSLPLSLCLPSALCPSRSPSPFPDPQRKCLIHRPRSALPRFPALLAHLFCRTDVQKVFHLYCSSALRTMNEVVPSVIEIPQAVNDRFPAAVNSSSNRNRSGRSRLSLQPGAATVIVSVPQGRAEDGNNAGLPSQVQLLEHVGVTGNGAPPSVNELADQTESLRDQVLSQFQVEGAERGRARTLTINSQLT